ncbi:MAG: metal-dependent hydrolase [Myxococcaceae bacterium]
MNPIIHGELSWLLAQKLEARRDRLLVMAAGLAPDLDGLTLLAGEDAYGRWHHLLSHGFVAALGVTGACALFARRRLTVALLALAAFHLHLVCDLAGSGAGWPLYYLYPFSERAIGWSGGWELASWQNTTIGLAITLACLGCALKFRRTFVEVFSVRADARVVAALRARFLREKPAPSGPAPGA